jgi:hypothetical protein
MFGYASTQSERGGIARVLSVRVRVGVALDVVLVCVVATTVFAGVASARWSVQPTPRLKNKDVLNGVSCVTRSECVAVGGPTNNGRLFSERWNGRAWSLRRMPTPDLNNSPTMDGVSCSSPTACTAVGSSGNHVLVERWNGKKWSIQHVPSPTKTASSDLAGVSCPSKTDCVAVGDWYTNSGNINAYGLLESWNGRRWSIQATPAYASFTSVSCASRVACTAVGTTADNILPLAERWDGTHWSVQNVRLDSVGSEFNGSTQLNAVSCPSNRACAAVGAGTGAESGFPPYYWWVAEFWDGEQWGHVFTAYDTNDDEALNGVSCNSTKSCLAVGDEVQHWNGERWSSVRSPFCYDGSSGQQLMSVSCSSATSCEVVGSKTNIRGAIQPLAARWTS